MVWTAFKIILLDDAIKPRGAVNFPNQQCGFALVWRTTSGCVLVMQKTDDRRNLDQLHTVILTGGIQRQKRNH